ncbi:MAG: ankyrin repeat domain-containing protein, partial [Planctomycetota bacterium]
MTDSRGGKVFLFLLGGLAGAGITAALFLGGWIPREGTERISDRLQVDEGPRGKPEQAEASPKKIAAGQGDTAPSAPDTDRPGKAKPKGKEVLSTRPLLPVKGVLKSAGKVSAKRPVQKLFILAMRGNLEEIMKLLAGGLDIHTQGSSGLTALHEAARRGQQTAINTLLKAGADIHVRDRWGRTPLHLAANRPYPQIAELLLNNGANPNTVDDQGWNPLSIAVMERHQPVENLLRSQGARLPSNREADVGLLVAARMGDVDAARQCLAQGANLEIQDFQGYTPLARAAEEGHTDCVRFLAGRGANLQWRSRRGESLLHRVVATENASMGEVLLQAGAAVDARNADGETPLHAALSDGLPALASLFLSHNASVEVRENHGDTPLFYAIDYQDEPQKTAMVRLLLENGANTRTKDANGNSILHRALNNSPWSGGSYTG